jgi:hypothetical protein
MPSIEGTNPRERDVETAPIRLFNGWQVALRIDEALMEDDVFAAHDEQGVRYLVAHTSDTTWLCTPVSERALDCVASGRAELRAVFAHSSTGMVERLTVHGSVVCQESVVPCSELTDDELPRAGVRLSWLARCA